MKKSFFWIKAKTNEYIRTSAIEGTKKNKCLHSSTINGSKKDDVFVLQLSKDEEKWKHSFLNYQRNYLIWTSGFWPRVRARALRAPAFLGSLYSSCVALFYRKRLPQQNGDRRIGERETCMHVIVCRAKVGARAFPSPPHAIRRRALCAMAAPPHSTFPWTEISDFQEKRLKSMTASF